MRISNLQIFMISIIFLSCSNDHFFSRNDGKKSSTNEVVEDREKVEAKESDAIVEEVPKTPENIKQSCNDNNISLKRTLSFIETTDRCRYNEDGNLSRRQGFVRARREESLKINLPENTAICEFKVKSVNQDLRYDDFMFLALNNFLLVGSSGTLVEELDTNGPLLEWNFNNIIDKPADFLDSVEGYCLGGSGECTIPGHDDEGPMEINFNSEEIFELSSRISEDPALDFNLITTGDNDNDCFHTDFTLDIDITLTNL